VIIEVLAAHARIIVSIRIISPTKDTSIRDSVGKKIAQPVHLVFGPCLILVSVQAMDSNNAAAVFRESNIAREIRLLDDGANPFCHNL
jgi:hypothetical protein